jgi:hypothetical protein
VGLLAADGDENQLLALGEFVAGENTKLIFDGFLHFVERDVGEFAGVLLCADVAEEVLGFALVVKPLKHLFVQNDPSFALDGSIAFAGVLVEAVGNAIFRGGLPRGIGVESGDIGEAPAITADVDEELGLVMIRKFFFFGEDAFDDAGAVRVGEVDFLFYLAFRFGFEVCFDLTENRALGKNFVSGEVYFEAFA